jgi:hypothetical protein
MSGSIRVTHFLHFIKPVLNKFYLFQIKTKFPAKFNLNFDQVTEIASFFTKLLGEIKHRGAFEQAYLGFCNLCNFLWRKNPGNCFQPTEMLGETMAALTGIEKNKFCSTRRSAGVPFLIQVKTRQMFLLICTEECYSNGQTFKTSNIWG